MDYRVSCVCPYYLIDFQKDIFLVSDDIFNAVVRNCAGTDLGNDTGCFEDSQTGMTKCICGDNLCNDHCVCNSAAKVTRFLWCHMTYTLFGVSLSMLMFREY